MRSRRTSADSQTSSGIAQAARRSAGDSIRTAVGVGLEVYDRGRHLRRLLPLAPEDLHDDGVAARRKIVARLARALRAERNRGRAGHWTYDLNRHIGLSQAYRAERRHLKSNANVEPARK